MIGPVLGGAYVAPSGDPPVAAMNQPSKVCPSRDGDEGSVTVDPIVYEPSATELPPCVS